MKRLCFQYVFFLSIYIQHCQKLFYFNQTIHHWYTFILHNLFVIYNYLVGPLKGCAVFKTLKFLSNKQFSVSNSIIICIDLWCTKDDNTRVELRHCLVTGTPIPPSIQRCHADCHTPCQLTEWSSWSPCKQPCSGVKIRTRELIGQ